MGGRLMNFVNRSVHAASPAEPTIFTDNIAVLVARWFTHRARARALWTEMDLLALHGEDATEGQSAKLAEEACCEVESAERIMAALSRTIPPTIDDAHRMQAVPIAILHHRRRERDITASLAVGPVLQILENVQIGLRCICGEMSFGDAHDALLIRQVDSDI
jgi:hypothetical protein